MRKKWMAAILAVVLTVSGISPAVKAQAAEIANYTTASDWEISNKNPAETEITYDGSATLQVEISGKTEGLTYKWSRGNGTVIEGATESSYTLTGKEAVENEGGDRYFCTVSDGTKSASCLFSIKVDTGLEVNSTCGTGDNTARNVSVPYSGETVLSVTASGGKTGILNYQWYQNGTRIEGATGNSYTITGKEAAETRASYNCKVSDGASQASRKEIHFWINIDTGLEVSSASGSETSLNNNRFVSVAYNEETTLNVTASGGVGVFSYQWYKINNNIPTRIEGAAGNSYTITGKTALEDGRQYQCIVSDSFSSKFVTFEISVDTGLEVGNGETYYKTDMGYEIPVSYEEGIILHVAARGGLGTYHYQWHVRGTDKWETIAGATTDSYPVTAADLAAGKLTYSCDITDGVTERHVSFLLMKEPGLKGKIFTIGPYKYKITNTSEAAFAGLKNNKTTKVTIPKTVKIKGKTFKITSISSKALRKTRIKEVKIGSNVKTIENAAFENCSKLSKVIIGTGVTKIGDNAFRKCGKLSNIQIQSTKLKIVGKNALKGINAKAQIKVPAKKWNAYKKLLKGKGQGKKVKIIKK